MTQKVPRCDTNPLGAEGRGKRSVSTNENGCTGVMWYLPHELRWHSRQSSCRPGCAGLGRAHGAGTERPRARREVAGGWGAARRSRWPRGRRRRSCCSSPVSRRWVGPGGCGQRCSGVGRAPQDRAPGPGSDSLGPYGRAARCPFELRRGSGGRGGVTALVAVRAGDFRSRAGDVAARGVRERAPSGRSAGPGVRADGAPAAAAGADNVNGTVWKAWLLPWSANEQLHKTGTLLMAA